MKKSILFSILILILSFDTKAYADTWVNGYTKSNGTFVQGHYRSSPDNNIYNNWSTKGNVNPYTGKIGTKNPDYYDIRLNRNNLYDGIFQEMPW